MVYKTIDVDKLKQLIIHDTSENDYMMTPDETKHKILDDYIQQSASHTPQHAIEVRITIGANTKEYLLETLNEILNNFEDANSVNRASGSYGGSHSVTTVLRDISPEAYRAELEEWSKSN